MTESNTILNRATATEHTNLKCVEFFRREFLCRGSQEENVSQFNVSYF